MGSQRVLAFLIALILAGGIVSAVVKHGENKEPLAQTSATPTPSETMTFTGPPPFESDTPIIPPTTPTEQTSGTGELPRTGGGSTTGWAIMTLLLAAAGGWTVARTARLRPSSRR